MSGEQSEVPFRRVERPLRFVGHQSYHDATCAEHHVIDVANFLHRTDFALANTVCFRGIQRFPADAIRRLSKSEVTA